MSEQRTRLHDLITELEDGRVINAQESKHLNSLIAEAIATVREPISRIEASEGMSPNERLALYLQSHKIELAQRLFQEFPDGGEKDKEPMENVLRFMMNNFVFPEIAEEIEFEDNAQATRFMLARLAPLLANLDQQFKNGLLSRLNHDTGSNPYWTRNNTYQVSDQASNNPAKAFWSVARKVNDQKITNLKDAMVVISKVIDRLHGNRTSARKSFSQVGYLFYRDLQGTRPTGNISILTIKDYEAIIDRAIDSLVVQKSTDQVSLSVSDFPALKEEMILFLKQQAIRGQIDTVLEGELFDGRTPATQFKNHHNSMPEERGVIGKFFGWDSKKSLEAAISEDVAAEVRALTVIADFILDVHTAGVTKSTMGVDDAQRELGAIKMEFARLYQIEWRRRCIDHSANTPIRDTLATLLHEVEDLVEGREEESIDARLKRAADAEVEDLTDERRREEGLDRVRRASAAKHKTRQ